MITGAELGKVSRTLGFGWGFWFVCLCGVFFGWLVGVVLPSEKML